MSTATRAVTTTTRASADGRDHYLARWFDGKSRQLLPSCLLIGALLGFSAAAIGQSGIGHPAPDFQLPRLDAPGTVQLSALSGHWVYVDFWASWCPPCRESFPWMSELASNDQLDELRIVAVGVDRKRANARKFLNQRDPAFIVAWDGDGSTPAAYHVKAMPSSYLVDPNGIIRYIHLGFRNGQKQALREKIAAIIATETR